MAEVEPNDPLVAFANAGGGLILLGVNDQGRAVGVSDLKRATDNVVEAIAHCSPPLGIGLPQSVEMTPGVTVLVIEIPVQLPRVYHTHGRYLQRSGSMNLGLDEATLRRLLYERGELSFEAEPVTDANLPDLDQAKVTGFRQRYEDIYGRGLTLPNRDLLTAMVFPRSPACCCSGGRSSVSFSSRTSPLPDIAARL